MLPGSAINAVCPYYTMFPLDFPLRVISRRPRIKGWVADPFCGRGTTNLAARLSGLPTFGMDSSPIAVAIAEAKLCDTTASQVERAAQRILEQNTEPVKVPSGRFWRRMYHRETLRDICKLRQSLMSCSRSDARKALRAIILGALHGPVTKTAPSHLSNQSPRTYAPKPAYALSYWVRMGMFPPKVNVLEVIRLRAMRFFAEGPRRVDGIVRLGDSRLTDDYPDIKIGLVVTSPPYYGMRTYVPDQWLRSWFLGGPPAVDYKHPTREIQHASPEEFRRELRSVWTALAQLATNRARLVVRFGAINDRDIDHISLMKESLRDSGWRLRTVVDAGDANGGKRQARQFLHSRSAPKTEYDYHATVG